MGPWSLLPAARVLPPGRSKVPLPLRLTIQVPTHSDVRYARPTSWRKPSGAAAASQLKTWADFFLLALGARGVRSGVGMRTERWHRLATAPLALAFLPLAVVLYVDAELSARLPLTSNEMDGGSLLMRCAFGACIPFFLLVAVAANVVNGVKRLVRRPPPSD